jgi:enterochelin esterase-like enzyme
MLYELRYEGEATTVRVRGSIENGGELPMMLERGEWVARVELPAEVRAVYWFALDGEEDWTRWLPDPRNPRRYVYPAGLEFTGAHEIVGSLLEGPAAPPFRWTVPRDVPRGTVTCEELDGRRVWRYMPAAEPEALLVLFDGHQYTTLAPAPTVLDNLIADGAIPPTAAVLPDSLDTEARMRDLGGRSTFDTWVTTTLVPWSGVRVTRAQTVVAGSSMGGLASLRLAAARPDVFGAVLVQSGGFPGMPVVVPPGLGLRFWLDVGVLEDRLLASTRELRDDLRAKGYEVAYREFPGGHDFFWWGETLADGLAALLRPAEA